MSLPTTHEGLRQLLALAQVELLGSHSMFSHDYQKDANTCPKCKLRTRISQALASTGVAEVPAGVYYCSLTDNFYDVESGKGMGEDFHRTWKIRREKFPSSVLAAKARASA